MAYGLTALGVATPNIDPVGAAQDARSQAINQQGAKISQAGELQDQDHKALDAVGALAFGVLNGNPDGTPDPERSKTAVQMLGANNPLAAFVEKNPQAWNIIAKSVMEAKKSTNTTTWANTTVPIKVDNGDGTFRYELGQVNDQGGGKVVDFGPGAQPIEPTSTVNLGSSQGVVTKGGDLVKQLPIDSKTPAYDTAVGRGQGEKDVALPETQAADKGALSGLERQVGVVTDKVDQAISQIDSNPGWQTGFIGNLASAVQGTPQYDLAQTLQTIKASVGFDRLQEMRDNSKTGGALGAISDTENKLLQAVNGSLEQGQTAEQLKANLENIKQLQAEVVAEKQAAYEKKYAGGDAGSANTKTSDKTGVPSTAEETKTLKGKTYYRVGSDWFEAD